MRAAVYVRLSKEDRQGAKSLKDPLIFRLKSEA
jgi:hypothetical protein